MRKVMGNTYEVKLSFAGGRLGLGTFIKGRVLLVPFHFLTLIVSELESLDSPDGHFVILSKVIGALEYKIAFEEFLDYKQTMTLDGNDMCMIELPRRVKNHSNIIDFFSSSRSLRDTHEIQVMIDDFKLGCHISSPTVAVPRDNFDVHSDDFDYKVRRGYVYTIASYAGMCGAIVSRLDPNCPKSKIVGIHVAGTASRSIGNCCVLTREDIDEAMSLFREQIDDPVPEDEVHPSSQCGLVVDKFPILQHIERSINIPSHTKLMKSKVYGAWSEPKTKPVNLSEKRVENSLYTTFETCMRSYGKDPVYVDKFEIEMVTHCMTDQLKHGRFDMEKRIFSFEEAIVGIPGDDSFNAIPRSTSAGYPHNLTIIAGKPGKERFFGSGEEYDLHTPEAVSLRNRVFTYIEQMKKGKRPFLVHTDYKKDERLPIEKVDKGKIRMISAAPLEMTILFRMYFGAFTKFLVDNRIDNGIAIGVNPYSCEWDEIANKLLCVSNRMGAGDFKGYDKSHQEWIIDICLDIIQRLYDGSEDENRIREILFLDVSNARHVYGSVVYEMIGPLASGGPLTPVINNLCNHILHRLCFSRILNKSVESYALYDSAMYVITMGDDSDHAVAPEYSSLVNEVTLSEAMSHYGYTYTPDVKDGALNPVRSLTDISFLKRKYVYDNSFCRYIAPLDIDVILEVPYWTKKMAIRDVITEDNVNLALSELSLHPKEIFDKYCPIIVKAFRDEYSKHPKTTNYLILRTAILNKKATW
jgi:hypothetical protein